MTDRTERARRIIAKTLDVPLFEVLDWTRLDDICRDSADSLDLLFQLEQEFDVELRHEKQTFVGDLFRAIEKGDSTSDSRTGASVPVQFVLVGDPVEGTAARLPEMWNKTNAPMVMAE